MGAVQGHEHLLFHGFKADGRSGRDKLGQLAVPARQNADGFLFDQLIGDIGFIRLQSRQGEIDLSLLQQPLQTGGGGLGQLDGHIGIGFCENGNHIRQHLHGPGNADAQAQAAAVIPADTLDFLLQLGLNLQHGLHCPEVTLSGIGQVEGRCAAVKKRRTRFVLDLAEGLAQGGLADIKLFCGGCDGSIFGNGFEIQGLLHIHIIFTTFLQHFHEIY